tara:strand:- start:58612 stop:58932 length:321 start_codon:yes stop_codon:yes gene_type:complete
MEHLKKRSDFIYVSRGQKIVTPSFILLKNQNRDELCKKPTFGFTVTKKIGTAVVRNRVKRRLKEAIRQIESRVEKDNSYVIIARKKITDYPYSNLLTDLENNLAPK